LRALGVAVVLAVVFLAILASAFSPAAPGTFEFGIRRTYEGQLLEGPLPLLRSVAADGTVTHRLLVGAGKHGLPAFARGHHGETVRFEGTRIESGRLSLVEMNAPESFRVLDPAPGPLPPVRDMEVGEVLLEGELVDTKCWAGVMRPATGKVHRACAIVCLRGGVPPGLLVRDGAGNAVVVLLVGTGGRPLDLDPRLAARILRVSGRLAFQGEVPRLEVAHVSLVIP
jgi:hypothetical protein